MHGYDTPYNVALNLNLNLSDLERLSVYRDKLCDDKYEPQRLIPLRNIKEFNCA
jgi:hypothetical protein